MHAERAIMGVWRTAFVVFRKELTDTVRDRRTWLVVLLSSVFMGPVALVLLSTLVASLEDKAQSRLVLVQGIEHAPSLRNYLERQTYRIESPPVGYEDLLRQNKLADPVLVVPPDFERELAAGEAPTLELVNSRSNTRASAGAGRVGQLLEGFKQEVALLRLTARGVAPALLEPIVVQDRDLSDSGRRAAQFFSVVPFFVLMAMVYGALGAALDSTAGERERGSLEPLLMNPVSAAGVSLGKWGAVALVAMTVAVLGSLSFLPAQALLRSETLSALFHYGWSEAWRFLWVLMPLGAALSAVLMAISIRCTSFKEAQANAGLVLMVVSLTPMVSMFSPSGEERWHLWVPVLAQTALMGRVLRGEPVAATDLLASGLACAALALVCLLLFARGLRAAAVR